MSVGTNVRAKVTVTIGAEEHSSKQCVIVSFPTQLGSPIQGIGMSDRDFADIHEMYQKACNELVKGLPSELYAACNTEGPGVTIKYPETREQYLRAMRRVRETLADLSANLLALVFPSNVQELLARLRRLRDAGAASLLRIGEPVADIDVTGDLQSLLPIEYIYVDWGVFDTHRDCEPWDESVGLPIIAQRLIGFVGFSFNVRRIPKEREAPNPLDPLQVWGDRDHLAVRFYPFDGLRTTQAERAFFGPKNRHRFNLHDVKFGSTAEAATRAVRAVLGTRDGPPVHHLACHFTPGDRGLHLGGCLRLGPCEGGFDVQVIRLGHEPPALHEGWVAFVNACEATTTTSLMRSTLVRLFFLNLRAACLIGPDIEVPDAFASEFARVFYAYWLRERDLGLALFKARWFFVLRHRNPVALGLFYVHFAPRPIFLKGVGTHVFL